MKNNLQLDKVGGINVNKKILLLTICAVAVVLVASVVGVLASRNLSGDVIKNEETALKIGSALLDEYLGYSRSESGYDLAALEENGVWTVYSSPIQHKDYITLDGGVYVKFRKSDGKVIEFYREG